MACRFSPSTINDPSFNQIVTFILLIVCTPHYFKNPYLLAKVVEIIFIMTPGIIPGNGNTLDMFMSHPLASGQLPRALINLYIGERIFFILRWYSSLSLLILSSSLESNYL